jgi:hypothetical protein
VKTESTNGTTRPKDTKDALQENKTGRRRTLKRYAPRNQYSDAEENYDSLFHMF